ncbi:MAG: ROK family protein [Acidobacteriia bacterium]|nr:ROK family protein [Terriglobia bacterium]
MFGAVEAGGTKFVCGVGTGPDDLITASFPTTSPEATVEAIGRFFERQAGAELAAMGIGSFGPVDLDPGSATFGYITSTPKLEWQQYDLAGEVGRMLGVPVGFDTDVNAAALGEARWGAGRGISDFLYLTVGTGIGGGAMAHGKLLHGLVHPEMGHIPIPHDRAADPYRGGCPYHGDCLEGLASGPAMEARWGMPAQELPAGHPGWALEAHYLALGLATWVCTLSPRRIILGGGVMQQPALFPLVRRELAHTLNGYIRARELSENLDRYVVPPQLGSRSGVLGALVLAEEAHRTSRARITANAAAEE